MSWIVGEYKFTRDHIMEMDRRAVAKMAQVHPERDLVAKMRAALERKRNPPTEPVTVEVWERWLERKPAPTTTNRAKSLAASIARERGVAFADIVNHSRKKALATVRHEAMFYLAKAFDPKMLSYSAIGKLLGDRDHTTVINGIRAHWQRSGATGPLPRGLSPEKGSSR